MGLQREGLIKIKGVIKQTNRPSPLKVAVVRALAASRWHLQRGLEKVQKTAKKLKTMILKSSLGQS